MTEARKTVSWKRPYLAPRIDRAQRNSVEGKTYADTREVFGYRAPS